MIELASPAAIDRAVHLLHQGECVGFPTETVYGLGAAALNPVAVQKIYSLKGRPSTNPLIIHLAEAEALSSVAVVTGRTEELKKLLPLWPGPLTVVLPKQSVIPSIVTGGGDSVAVRIPAHPIAQRLLRAAKIPIAAPSANRSQHVSPTSAQHVWDEFGESLSLILDGGPCQVGIESTVLSLVDEVPRILRPGSITVEQLTAILGRVETVAIPLSSEGPMPAPGMTALHYAPTTPSRLWSSGEPLPNTGRWGFIGVSSKQPFPAGATVARSLSSEGDLNQVAQNLFHVLRELDQYGLDELIIERCSEVGIGVAIMDRLRRATARGDAL
jgi:L-threonylcarbamoyladenylate synthase